MKLGHSLSPDQCGWSSLVAWIVIWDREERFYHFRSLFTDKSFHIAHRKRALTSIEGPVMTFGGQWLQSNLPQLLFDSNLYKSWAAKCLISFAAESGLVFRSQSRPLMSHRYVRKCPKPRTFGYVYLTKSTGISEDMITINVTCDTHKNTNKITLKESCGWRLH